MNIKFTPVNASSITQETYERFGISNKALSVEYYQEYYGASFQDLSFLVIMEHKVVGYVSCCELNGKLCLVGNGICIRLDDENSKGRFKLLHNAILSHLQALAKEGGGKEIIIKDILNNGQLSCLGEILFNNRYKSSLTFEMLVNYSDFTENNYYRVLRKSYKSLVNWGRKNLDIVYINNQNPCRDSFSTFQQFHQKISGRITRSERSWQLQYDMVCNSFGELILAYLDGKLVAGSLFVDQDNVSIYFTGVYERELFNFGLSHYLTYQGIYRSHLRGNTSCFSLGYFDSDIQDPKWYNVQFFKKGFCKQFVPIILWSKSFKEGSTNE